MLAVEDPQDPTNDLAKGSYSIQKVPACLLLCNLDQHHDHCLTLEDPRGTNDLAKGGLEHPEGAANSFTQTCFLHLVRSQLKTQAFAQVRSAFDFAYQQLCAPARPGEAILHRIIRWEPMFEKSLLS